MRTNRPVPAARSLDARTARKLRALLTARLTERLGELAPIEDFVQDTLLRLLKSRSRRTPEANARRIADRLAAGYEAEHRRWRLGQLMPLPLAELEPQLSAPDAQTMYELRVTRECLMGAFGQLPIDVRRLIMMHDIDEIPLKEIAILLGCSATSAKIRLRRARIRLSEVCRAACHGEVGSDGAMLCLPREGAPLASQPRRRAAVPTPRRRRKPRPATKSRREARSRANRTLTGR